MFFSPKQNMELELCMPGLYRAGTKRGLFKQNTDNAVSKCQAPAEPLGCFTVSGNKTHTFRTSSGVTRLRV